MHELLPAQKAATPTIGRPAAVPPKATQKPVQTAPQADLGPLAFVKTTAEGRQLLRQFLAVADGSTQQMLKQLAATMNGGKTKKNLALIFNVGSEEAPPAAKEVKNETKRISSGLSITITRVEDNLNGRPNGNGPAGPYSGITLAFLADELRTAYQYEGGGQLAAVLIDAGKTKEYKVQAYDVMDELETKVAAVLILHNQKLPASYLDLPAFKQFDSIPIMRRLFTALYDVEQEKKPVTMETVRDKFLKQPDANKVLLELATSGYSEFLSIKYGVEDSTFTDDGGYGGQAYMEAKIDRTMRRLNLKFSSEAARQKVRKRMIEEEQSLLVEKGVRYRFDAN